MRIALDPSVSIAAHISRTGVCAELLEDLLLHHELVTSEFVLQELHRKLMEKFNFPKRDKEPGHVDRGLGAAGVGADLLQARAVGGVDELRALLPFRQKRSSDACGP